MEDVKVIYKWIVMKKYTAIYYISRWKTPWDMLYCTKCFKWSDINFDIHHIYWRWEDLTYNPKNLSLLCRRCHNKAWIWAISAEEIYNREEKKIKVLLDSYDDYYEIIS